MLQLKNEIFVGGLITLSLIAATVVYALSYSAPKKISLETSNLTPSTESLELAGHNTPSDCWIMIDEKTLDVTSFLNLHPGGAEAITPYCGKDATAAFDRVGHSNRAVALFANYLIGLVGQTIDSSLPAPQTSPIPLIKEEREDDD